MNDVKVRWNFSDVDTTFDNVRNDDDACAIYVEGDPVYDEHIGLSVNQAEGLIVELRTKLDELYAKEDAE